MKKTIISSLLLLLCLAPALAQEPSAFRKDLRTILADAQNEFAGSQGNLAYNDTVNRKQYFSSGITLGGTLSFIQHNLEGNYKVFVCSYDLTKDEGLMAAAKYLNEVLEELNQMAGSGNFRGRDYKADDGTGITELTDLDGNYVMELNSTSELIKVMVYAKSWGKR